MIKVKSSLFLIFLFVLTQNIFSQVQVDISEKQIFILGKKYYLHQVIKGQTLYSISKAYHVSEHEIIAENTDILDGLKEGSEIKIPVVDVNEKYTGNSDDNFIYHKVERKQTLYFLSNKYNVSEAELLRLNPEISQGLKVGQTIKIPQPGSSITLGNTGYKLHTIQPGETLFSLSQMYGIEIDALKAQNPELAEKGPRIGQVIKISLEKKSFEETNKTNIQNNNVTIHPNYDPVYVEDTNVTPCSDYRYNPGIQFKVAVLLPLFLQENSLTKGSGKYYKNTRRFFEFYYGLLLAAKRLKEDGVSVEFFIKDTKTESKLVRDILNEPQMKEMDLIIGPVYSDNFKMAGEFAKENKINIVAPFKQKNGDLLVNNPYVFFANPGDETEVANICRYIAESPNRSVVLVHNGTAEELEMIELFKRKITSTLSSDINANGIVYKQVDFKSQGESALDEALSVGLENIVVVPSKDMVFVTNIATRLNYLSDKYKMIAFGMYPWEQFESVEIEYLQNLNFHYGTTNFVDRNDEKVKIFDYQYKTYFKDEPSIYSYLGYDIAWYFTNILKDYGKQYQFCLGTAINKGYSEGLRFDFHFERINPYSGYENNWLRVIRIDENMQMVRVK